jgi:hypothetical protein
VSTVRNGAQLHGDSKQDEHATQERDEQFCQCFKCFVRTTPIRCPSPVIVSQFSSIYYLISFVYTHVVKHDPVVAILDSQITTQRQSYLQVLAVRAIFKCSPSTVTPSSAGKYLKIFLVNFRRKKSWISWSSRNLKSLKNTL